MTEASRATLDSLPVTSLKGVGQQVAKRLERLDIHTAQDLLFHLPARYQDRTRVTPIGALRPGDSAVIIGTVELTQVKYGRRRSLLSVVADGSGSIGLRLFHFSKVQQAALARGNRVRCFGEVRLGPHSLELVHPEYNLIDEDESVGVEEHLTPVYPTTEGVHQLSLRGLTDQALALLAGDVGLDDYLPASVLERLGYPRLRDALSTVHRPPPETPLEALETAQHPARQRLAFEELLAHHMSLRMLRKKFAAQSAPAFRAGGTLGPRFIVQLAFTLTGAQTRVVAEIRRDLALPHPMHRLVQGDVGSGKTVVAAIVALDAVEAGYQVAIMAPTELLAEQHLRSFRSWLEPLEIEVAWLSGKLTKKIRSETLAAIADGAIAVCVGTHALFQDDVKFQNLGLIVVDEQHRFGVHQRLALRTKGMRDGLHPHQLIMTATPIPRTLAMTAYADLDTSVIDALPPGRSPVKTAVVPDTRRDEIIERIRAACRDGRQAYWVCTLIEESEALQCQAASDTAAALSEALPALRIGLVHGRLKSAEKEQAMAAFAAGEIDLLVATTVIEVGVDVPNASLMIIENAERLGLAQLHQLRGRVGRGATRSVCVLMYRSPLSESGRARLGVLRETNDGFEIAQRDLELRGPGEVLGTRQTGALQFRVADLMRDRDLFPQVERAATTILKHHPERVAPLIRRWLGDSTHYGDV